MSFFNPFSVIKTHYLEVAIVPPYFDAKTLILAKQKKHLVENRASFMTKC